jgi:hypothetical protein
MLLRPRLLNDNQGASKVKFSDVDSCNSPKMSRCPSSTKAHLDNTFKNFIHERKSNAIIYDGISINEDENISD